mgnify:CR=1 FL=1
MERDRELLTNVPIAPVSDTDKAKVYRFQQWIHMLRNYGEIINLPEEKEETETA